MADLKNMSLDSDDASIQVSDSVTAIGFHWRGFEGDDCFTDFRIEVTEHGIVNQFAFGPCAIVALRKLVRFFQDSSLQSASGGFQNPDKRFYDVSRTSKGLCLAISFEGDGTTRNIDLIGPSVKVNDEILRTRYER